MSPTPPSSPSRHHTTGSTNHHQQPLPHHPNHPYRRTSTTTTTLAKPSHHAPPPPRNHLTTTATQTTIIIHQGYNKGAFGFINTTKGALGLTEIAPRGPGAVPACTTLSNRLTRSESWDGIPLRGRSCDGNEDDQPSTSPRWESQ
nr:hypothetical protein [Tanacetum cinerariifolium]